MQILKAILFFQPGMGQKQTDNFSAAGWVLQATWDVCMRSQVIWRPQPAADTI